MMKRGGDVSKIVDHVVKRLNPAQCASNPSLDGAGDGLNQS
jgi:hypothetical protein